MEGLTPEVAAGRRRLLAAAERYWSERPAVRDLAPLRMAMHPRPFGVRPLPAESPIDLPDYLLLLHDVFDRKLLLMGTPDADPTPLLRPLHAALLGRAAAAAHEPVPVLFSLRGWSRSVTSLAEWLALRIAARHGGTRRLAQQMVYHGTVLPMLAGLERLSNPDAAAAMREIERYLWKQAEPCFVLACRDARLRSLAIALPMGGEIETRRLSDAQVERCLADRPHQLAGLAALRGQNETLAARMRRPADLSMLATIAAGLDPHEIAERTSEEGPLVAAFLDAAGSRSRGLSPETIRAGLSTVTAALQGSGGHGFREASLQPFLLESVGARRLYLFLSGIALALPPALWLGLLVALREFGRRPPIDAVLTGLLVGLYAALLFGPLYAVIRDLAGRRIERAPRVRWDADRWRGLVMFGATRWAGYGFLISLVALTGLTAVAGPVRSVLGGIVIFAFLTISGGLLFALRRLLAIGGRGVPGPRRMAPVAADLRRAAGEAVQLGGVYAAAAALLLGVTVLLFGLFAGQRSAALLEEAVRSALVASLLVGTLVFVAAWLIGGGYGAAQRGALRVVLALWRRLPLNLTEFLHQAQQLGLLADDGDGLAPVYPLITTPAASEEPLPPAPPAVAAVEPMQPAERRPES